MEILGGAELWVVLGVVLLVIEIFAVSFFFMFFGLGALATALLTYLDVTKDFYTQLIAFGLVSVASMLLFRKQLRELFYRKGEDYNEFLNEKAKVVQPIPAKGEGKVFYRGTEWLAEAIGGQAIAVGTQVKIKKVDGIRFFVEEI